MLDEQEVFQAARQLPAVERGPFLESACGDNVALRERVEALLRVTEGRPDFLEQPAICVDDDPDIALIGQCIGPYKLLAKIGSGGMGVVFLAEQTEPVRRQVALKIIRAGMDSRQVLTRFEAERQALALMDHPNIAKVLDAGASAPAATGGRSCPYFVMEWLKGVPITEYCDVNRLTPRQRLELFIPVCEAVQHAHQKGVIHRDLKPSNVLVADYDGRPIPKVIDFGVAKALDPKLTERALDTAIDMIVGTLEYMSPEQAKAGRHDVDTRSDVYALGVLLYELLTGTTPLTARQLKEGALLEALRIIRDEEPPMPSNRLSTIEELPSVAANRGLEPRRLSGMVRGDLDWIAMKALEKDRERRYATANGLARDIERFLNEEPVEAGPPSVAYKLRKFVRRHRAALVSAAAFALLIMSASAVSIWLAVRATMAERAADHERDTAVAEKDRADEEAAIAKAVNEFLQKDLLDQADIAHQPAGAARDKDITVRAVVDRAATRIGERFHGQELTEAAIRMTLGNAYRALGDLEKAQIQVERAVELRKRELGSAHLATLEAINSLAGVVWQRGNPGRAEAMYKDVYEEYRTQLGEHHLDTLKVLINVAMLDASNGRFDEAQAKMVPAVAALQAALGPTDPATMRAMVNLSFLYSSRGRHEQAIEVVKPVVEIARGKLADDHPLTMQALHNLGTSYLQTKKYAEAEPILRRLLDIRRAKQGPDHPDTLTTLTHLAFVVLESGRAADAEPLFRDALALSRVKPGPVHPLTLRIMNGLATTCHYRNQFAEAEKYFKEVVETRRKAQGPTDLETLYSLNNLAVFYKDRGQLDLAEPLLVEAVAGMRQKCSLDHPETRKYVDSLADCYIRQGKSGRAQSLLQELADHLRPNAANLGLAYANALTPLAACLLQQGKHSEAERIARECWDVRKRIEPEGWPTFRTQALIGAALAGQKKFVDAEPLLTQGYQGMVERIKKVRPRDVWKVDEARKQLVQLYEDWGKPAEAETWRKAKVPGHD